jgi:glycosyltransferase involved in cell wall biosynthesis
MFVTNSLTGGGAERSMNIVVNELHSRNLEVVLVPINSGPRDQVNPQCKVVELNREWNGGLLETLKIFFNFHMLVIREKPSVIVLNCDLPEMFGAFLFFGYKHLIVVEHSSSPWKTRIRLGKFIRRILFRKSSLWVCVSDHLSVWPVSVHPNVVIPNPLLPINANIGPRSDMKISRLVFVGRLSAEKRPDFFRDVCSSTKLPGLIIGDGRMRSELENSVLENNLRIEFAGQQLDPWPLIQHNDLVIIPSEYEGDGLVLLEAMARNHSVLLNDIPDFRRFDLPQVNYCKSVEDFCDRILNYSDNIQSLMIPTEISAGHLEKRAIDSIGNAWEVFLSQTCRKSTHF